MRAPILIVELIIHENRIVGESCWMLCISGVIRLFRERDMELTVEQHAEHGPS